MTAAQLLIDALAGEFTTWDIMFFSALDVRSDPAHSALDAPRFYMAVYTCFRVQPTDGSHAMGVVIRHTTMKFVKSMQAINRTVVIAIAAGLTSLSAGKCLIVCTHMPFTIDSVEDEIEQATLAISGLPD
jgi:hypothetical protein